MLATISVWSSRRISLCWPAWRTCITNRHCSAAALVLYTVASDRYGEDRCGEDSSRRIRARSRLCPGAGLDQRLCLPGHVFRLDRPHGVDAWFLDGAGGARRQQLVPRYLVAVLGPGDPVRMDVPAAGARTG